MEVYSEMMEHMTGRELTPQEKQRAVIAMQPNRKERRRVAREAKRAARRAQRESVSR